MLKARTLLIAFVIVSCTRRANHWIVRLRSQHAKLPVFSERLNLGYHSDHLGHAVSLNATKIDNPFQTLQVPQKKKTPDREVRRFGLYPPPGTEP